LMAGRAPAGARPGTTASAAGAPGGAAGQASVPIVPAGIAQSFLKHFGAEVADPYLLVKYAVRLKGQEESVGARAWPLDAASAAEVFDGDELAVTEADLAEAP